MVEVVKQLRSDAAADLIRSLPPDFAAQVFGGLGPERRAPIEEILSYPPDCAGAMMAKEFLSVPEGMNVADAIEYLHLTPREKKGRNPYIYIISRDGRLKGVIETQDLILNPLDTSIDEIMTSDVLAVPTSYSKNEVTKAIQSHRYLGLPVVDGARRLVGMILADTALQAVKDQADTDIAKIIGTNAEELKDAPVPRIVQLRLPWLLFSIASGLFCAYIAEVFQHGGQTLAVLFIFVPVVLGMSESIGIQGATIVVRRTTLGVLGPKDIRPLYFKEMFAGLIIGVICGLIAGTVTSLWQGNPLLGVAIAASMLATILVSAVVGLTLPLFFRAIKVDPAMASGPLVLALCDIQTLFVYFNLANFILTR
jgi:magnesium transporter